jgi:radical SAM protein with 4Fe4S-binding SPASM domain
LSNRIQAPGLALAFTPAEIEDARRQQRLLSLDISLTRACNLRCTYCYVGEPVSKTPELTEVEIRRVIDEALALGLKVLNLTGGEPLLYKRYFQVAEYGVGRGLSIFLFTNGWFMTAENATRLAELGVSVCLKMDSQSPEIQDRLAGKAGAHRAIETALSYLEKAGYGSRLPLAVNAVANQLNVEELPAFWQWARARGLTPSLTRLQPMGRAAGQEDLSLSPTELRTLFEKLAAIDAATGHPWETGVPWPHGKACRRHYIGAYVDAEGWVQPCSGVNIRAGSIRERPLAEILTGPVMRQAREIDHHLEGACGSCEKRDRCYGCRSLAYLSTGSFSGPDPLCWY